MAEGGRKGLHGIIKAQKCKFCHHLLPLCRSKPVRLTFFCGTQRNRKRVVWLCDLLTYSRFRKRGRCHGDRLRHGASGVKPTWAKLSWHQQRRVTRPQIPHLTCNNQNEKHVMSSHSQNTRTPSSLASPHMESACSLWSNSFLFSVFFYKTFQTIRSYPIKGSHKHVVQLIHHK